MNLSEVLLCVATLAVCFSGAIAGNAPASPAEVTILPVTAPEEKVDSWGGLLVDGSGKVCFTAGDHKSETGNAWAYRFDPASRRIERIIDVEWDGREYYDPAGLGHGKFHSTPLAGADGRIYLASAFYSGEDDLAARYQGALLFSWTPDAKPQPACHGIIFPHEGVFAAVLLTRLNALAAITLPSGRCQVYDLAAKKVVYRSEESAGPEARMIAYDRQERVYFCGGQGKVFRYDPRKKTAEPLAIAVPSAMDLPSRAGEKFSPKDDLIRAMKPVGGQADAFIGVTNYGMFFRYDVEKGTTTALQHALDRKPPAGPYYVPDFAVSKDGKKVCYVGGTENEINGYRHDNPVIEYDLESGKKRVLCRLNAVLGEQKFGRFLYNYGAALSPDEKTLYLSPNLSGGKVALVLIPVAETPPEQ